MSNLKIIVFSSQSTVHSFNLLLHQFRLDQYSQKNLLYIHPQDHREEFEISAKNIKFNLSSKLHHNLDVHLSISNQFHEYHGLNMRTLLILVSLTQSLCL